MKVLIDENLPPALAKGLAALFGDKHEIVHSDSGLVQESKTSNGSRSLAAKDIGS